MNPEETRSVEVMKYGLAMFLNLILSVGCSLMLGAMTGRFQETLEAIFAFAVLRRFSGGLHAPNLTACFLVSFCIFSVIPHIGRLVAEWHLWLASFCTIVLVLVFAHTDYSGQKRYVHKGISFLIVCVGVFYQAAPVTLAMFVQAVLLIKRR